MYCGPPVGELNETLWFQFLFKFNFLLHFNQDIFHCCWYSVHTHTHTQSHAYVWNHIKSNKKHHTAHMVISKHIKVYIYWNNFYFFVALSEQFNKFWGYFVREIKSHGLLCWSIAQRQTYVTKLITYYLYNCSSDQKTS